MMALPVADAPRRFLPYVHRVGYYAVQAEGLTRARPWLRDGDRRGLTALFGVPSFRWLSRSIEHKINRLAVLCVIDSLRSLRIVGRFLRPLITGSLPPHRLVRRSIARRNG